jgi:hypothetical protein
MAAGDLCTTAEVKVARRGLPSSLDTMIDALITRASASIASFTGRQFVIDAGAPPTATARIYEMGNDWTVYIDDLSATPTAVSILDAYGDTLSTLTVASDLVTLPRNRSSAQPITALRLRPSVSNVGPGNELSVTGVWGFPSVPDDVKEACITTVIEWLKDGEGVTPQTPDLFEPGAPPTRGFPVKARDILRRYRNYPVG